MIRTFRTEMALVGRGGLDLAVCDKVIPFQQLPVTEYTLQGPARNLQNDRRLFG
jgi:hypothetical protein